MKSFWLLRKKLETKALHQPQLIKDWIIQTQRIVYLKKYYGKFTDFSAKYKIFNHLILARGKHYYYQYNNISVFCFNINKILFPCIHKNCTCEFRYGNAWTTKFTSLVISVDYCCKVLFVFFNREVHPFNSKSRYLVISVI